MLKNTSSVDSVYYLFSRNSAPICPGSNFPVNYDPEDPVYISFVSSGANQIMLMSAIFRNAREKIKHFNLVRSNFASANSLLCEGFRPVIKHGIFGRRQKEARPKEKEENPPRVGWWTVEKGKLFVFLFFHFSLQSVPFYQRFRRAEKKYGKKGIKQERGRQHGKQGVRCGTDNNV